LGEERRGRKVKNEKDRGTYMTEGMVCTRCGNRQIVKSGWREVRFGRRQIYLCKGCGRRFCSDSFPGKTFPAKVIISAITLHNLGNSLIECRRKLKKRFRLNVSKSVISKWIREYRSILSYSRIRSEVQKKYGPGMVISNEFRHHGLTYRYKYHRAKLDMFASGFPGLRGYLQSLKGGLPEDYFTGDDRCSGMRIDIAIRKQGKRSHACKLAEFALRGVDSNRERHDAVEEFMLVNDNCTIAVEVPVWFWEKTLDRGITGHIDILQARYGKIYVLDYKPDAEKEKDAGAQLYLYALGLSFRAGIPMDKIRCAWFDEAKYYEFEPRKAVVKWK